MSKYEILVAIHQECSTLLKVTCSAAIFVPTRDKWTMAYEIEMEFSIVSEDEGYTYLLEWDMTHEWDCNFAFIFICPYWPVLNTRWLFISTLYLYSEVPIVQGIKLTLNSLYIYIILNHASTHIYYEICMHMHTYIQINHSFIDWFPW